MENNTQQFDASQHKAYLVTVCITTRVIAANKDEAHEKAIEKMEEEAKYVCHDHIIGTDEDRECPMDIEDLEYLLFPDTETLTPEQEQLLATELERIKQLQLAAENTEQAAIKEPYGNMLFAEDIASGLMQSGQEYCYLLEQEQDGRSHYWQLTIYPHADSPHQLEDEISHYDYATQEEAEADIQKANDNNISIEGI